MASSHVGDDGLGILSKRIFGIQEERKSLYNKMERYGK